MNLISYGENRIFVDIAYYGCGSGCQYCYTIKPNEKQKLITVDDKNNIINSLLKTKNLCDKIVSFSPNTEPFKSTESINTFTDIIREISTSGVYIQISTKEAMDVKCIELLNSLCKKNGQIIINVSLPFLTNTKILEPGASDIENRLYNFIKIDSFDKIKSCMYIKPFTSDTFSNVYKYIEIINEYKVKYVCIGMKFYKNNHIDACRSYYNDEAMYETINKNDVGRIFSFADEIRKNTDATIVFSTTCMFTDFGLSKCSAKFYKHDLPFCNNCCLKE